MLAAIRTLHRLECVQEALHHVLTQLSDVAPGWVQGQAPLEWYERYGPRAEAFRLPKETSKRDAMALVIGADGYALLDRLWQDDRARHLRELPAVETLRQLWLQHYYRCTVPGLEEVRWRQRDERPPSAQLIQSPYDLEARYCHKRDTQWVGYKAHFSETCDEGYPDLTTQVLTTPAPVPDCVMGPAIEQDLADRDLLPGTHLLDSGYVDA